MKRGLLLIAAAAMLFTACDEPAESLPETAEQTTTTTLQTTLAEPVSTTIAVLPQDTHTGGVDLTDAHKELRAEFSGADLYLYYSELGLVTTQCDDLVDRAYQMAEQAENFDTGYSSKRFGRILGADDGCFYFSLTYTYQHYVDAAEWWDSTFTDVYFCYNCDTDELTQISATDAYPEIAAVSNEVMVLRSDNNSYVALDRESGFLAELPKPMGNVVLIDRTVYYQFLNKELGVVRVGWTLIENGSASNFSDAVFDQSAGDSLSYPEYAEFDEYYLSATYSINRGVYSIVCQCNEYVARALNSNEYLIHDPVGRVKDIIEDTYYQGTVMAEENLLGSRLRFSITDRNGKEHILGFAQVDGSYYDDPHYLADMSIHATKDGVIFVDKGDTLLMLVTEPEEENSRVRAALLPEDIFTDSWEYIVRCDDERLYLFDGDSMKLVTVHR